MKLWSQESGSEIYYVGWVWEGNSEITGDIVQEWLSWKPKVLAIRGSELFYMEYPPVSFVKSINKLRANTVIKA